MSIWKLGRRQPACVDCEQEFADGDVLFSTLAFEEGRIDRHDRCPACWKAREEQPADGRWWRSRRQITKKAGLSVDLDGLEQIFHALAERTEERLLELRYLISLLLMRKRKLILGRAFVRSGSELLALRRPRRKEEILVQVFEFSPERMEELRADLVRLFEGDDLLSEDTKPSAEPEDSDSDADEEAEDPSAEESEAVQAEDPASESTTAQS